MFERNFSNYFFFNLYDYFFFNLSNYFLFNNPIAFHFGLKEPGCVCSIFFLDFLMFLNFYGRLYLVKCFHWNIYLSENFLNNNNWNFYQSFSHRQFHINDLFNNTLDWHLHIDDFMDYLLCWICWHMIKNVDWNFDYLSYRSNVMAFMHIAIGVYVQQSFQWPRAHINFDAFLSRMVLLSLSANW